MNERCFAMQRGGKCRALTVNCPGYAACGFYKPRWKYEKDQRMAYTKLRALPMDRQQEIADKYFKGAMPWRENENE